MDLDIFCWFDLKNKDKYVPDKKIKNRCNDYKAKTLQKIVRSSVENKKNDKK